jgi:DNA repair protein RadC
MAVDQLGNFRVSTGMIITEVLFIESHAIVATGWVQAARLSAKQVIAGAQASRATGCVIIRCRPYGLRSATEAEQRSFRSITGACWHHGLVVVDHLVVVATGEFSSSFLGGP